MYDLDDAHSVPEYECLACGAIVATENRPNGCPKCERAGTFQNRAFSLE